MGREGAFAGCPGMGSGDKGLRGVSPIRPGPLPGCPIANLAGLNCVGVKGLVSFSLEFVFPFPSRIRTVGHGSNEPRAHSNTGLIVVSTLRLLLDKHCSEVHLIKAPGAIATAAMRAPVLACCWLYRRKRDGPHEA
jgi:hypothetical protein